MIAMGSASLFAQDFVIPPLAECVAVDANQKQFRAGYGGKQVDCKLFGEEENMGCEKVMPAANAAIKKCQERGRGNCQIAKCWENPQ